MGEAVGSTAGEAVGSSVGETAGSTVGEAVGPSVGEAGEAVLGSSAGETACLTLGEAVGSSVPQYLKGEGLPTVSTNIDAERPVVVMPACGALGAASERLAQPHAMGLLCFRCRAIGYRQHRLGVQLSQPQARLSRL